ncbi:MAG TPA: AraC family transcriptional regulator, partial [Ignavibacteriaceae bacterium]|nr:AraC family transcriptional regulator [Ignavibacteriaceae bacterium]
SLWEINLYLYVFYTTNFFLVYPLLYLHFKTIIENRERKYLSTGKYFILPGIVLLVTAVFFFSLNYAEKLILIRADVFENSLGLKYYSLFQHFIIISYYAQFLVFITLFYLLTKKIDTQYSKKNQLSLWIKVFIFGALLYDVSIGLMSTYLNKTISLTIGQIFAMALLIFTGLMGINHSYFLIQLRLKKIKENYDENSPHHIYYNLPDEEKERIKVLFEDYLNETKIYLDPNLKIDVLSKKMHIASKKLSIVLNEVHKKNFTQIINEFRIEEATNLLKTRNISIDEVFHKAGFNSRSTFIRAFKSIKGIVPKEFKEQKKDNPAV